MDRKVIRVLLVDDHPAVRAGLRLRIGQESDMEVCGEAESGPDAMRLIPAAAPTVVVTDLSLKESSGLDLIKNIRATHPGVVVVVLSMHDETYFAERTLRSGAIGYVMKDQPIDVLIQAIRQAADGVVHVSDRMSARLLAGVLGRVPGNESSTLGGLSDREIEILEMLGRGLSTRRISEGLHISIKTVEAHRENIKRKLQLADANELVQFAVRWVMEAPPV